MESLWIAKIQANKKTMVTKNHNNMHGINFFVAIEP
jgi:hypothetical protein